MDGIRICLFGSPAIERNGTLIDPGRRKVSALAAYLSASKAPQSRDGICAMLWPEKDARAARAELRRTISNLRACVGSDFLQVTRSSVALADRVSVDVRQFESLLDSVSTHHHESSGPCRECRGALEEAVALYNDDFLAGFSLSDSAAFDDWVLSEAEHLRDMLSAALERLSHPSMFAGEDGLGESTLLAYAHQWLKLDDLNESAHRRLMRLYALSGQRGAALRQYAVCEKTLNEELDASPSPETTELKRKIETGSLECLPQDGADNGSNGSAGASAGMEKSFEQRPARTRRLLLSFAAFVVIAASLVVGYRVFAVAHRASPGIPIAVLPLVDDSSNSRGDWFADGMTEEITTDLAKIGALRVTSHSSVEVLAGAKLSIPQIRDRLGVDYVVEGSVLNADNRVRVTAQLIDAKSDRHVWADEYESGLTNIIALQGRIAGDIASQVSAHLSTGERKVLSRKRKVDPNAYEAYLLGAYELSRLPFDIGAAQKCLANLKRSIEIDGSYAPAHAALAKFYWGATQFGLYSNEDGLKLAKKEAERAVALDDGLSEAHTVLGFLYFLHDYDWKASRIEFERAIALNPSSAGAHAWYGSLLCTEGNFKEAIVEVTKARDLDPLSLINILNVAMRLYYSRDYDGAIVQAKIAREMEGNFYMSHMVLGYALAAKGSYDEAASELETAARLAGNGAMEPLAVLSYVYNKAGRTTDADDAQRRFDALGAKGMSLSPLLRAYIPLGRGDYNRAMDLIEQAYAEHDLNLAWNFQDPFFDPLRKMPRFVRLKRELKL